MSQLHYIQAFIHIVEENSFVAAAKKLGISTAAISKQMNRLEKNLKTELIKRTTRKLSLTEIGKQYYQQCKKILNELKDAESLILGSQEEATGILRITCARYIAMDSLIPRLNQFVKENPKLKIKLELADRIPDLLKENIDILFGISYPGPEELVRKRIGTTRYAICAAPKYLKKFGVPQKPEDLIKHRYITHSMRHPDNRVFFKDNQEVFVDPCLWLNDSQAMCECAVNGMGIIMVHYPVAKKAIEKGTLIEVLQKYKEPILPVYLFYQSTRYLQPKIRRFIDFFTFHDQ